MASAIKETQAVRRIGRLTSVLCSAAPVGGAAPAAAAAAQASLASGYRMPPQEIADIVDRPTEPLLSFSPNRKLVLQLSRPPPNPPISELAKPELKLAGLRINPDTFSRSRMSYYLAGRYVPFTDDVSIPLDEGHGQPITGIPAGYWINYVTWSPEGTHIAFTLRSAGGAGDPPAGPLELWVADVETGAARRLMAQCLNTVFEDYSWIDDDTICAAVLPEGLAPPPAKPAVPLGPRIEDNSSGRKSQARTYPDLLASDHDEQLFEYYGTSQLVTVKVGLPAQRRCVPTASCQQHPAGGALN